MKTINNTSIRPLTCAAMCLALCLLLPFLTGQIPQIGSALCPMHLPILLAGFLCGPWWAMLAGLTAPLLRHVLFAMPPLTTAIAMSFELAAYGAVSGLVYRKSRKTVAGIYCSLLSAMVAGRILWGIAMMLLTGVTETAFTWNMFLAAAFTSAVPGIIIQLILIPILEAALKRAKYIE